MWPSDQTTPAEARPAPPRAAAPRIVARPTQPPIDSPEKPAPGAAVGGDGSASAAAPASPTLADARAPERLRALPSWLLTQASAAAAKLVDDALAADGVRKQDYRVLVALDEAGAASQAELGRSVWLDRSDLHGIVTQLERRGLLERERDPRDRRRNVVQLTPEGKQTLGQLNTRVDDAQDLLLAQFSADEREAFVQLLRAIVSEDEPGGAT